MFWTFSKSDKANLIRYIEMLLPLQKNHLEAKRILTETSKALSFNRVGRMQM